jgi:chromate transporter
MGSALRTTSAVSDGAVKPPSLRQALRFWLKLGCISFGGPAGQIAIMHDELVEKRGWVSERRFLHALSFCFALPGPEAQQLATFVGWRLHGVRGAIAAGGLFVLPSFVLISALAFVYVEYGTVAAVEGIVRGLSAAVVGLVVAAVLRVGGRVVRTPFSAAVAVAAFASLMLGVPFPVIVLAAGLAGILLERSVPGSFRGLGHGADPGVGDEDRIPSGRAWRRGAAILMAWLVPVGALLLAGGVIADLAGFFSLTALITFGGAYAVLPFVADQAVHHFGWLTTNDMIAGLALGETTPGPLVMVNTFVGFMPGWTTHGSYSWAMFGATVATFCTFAPSFVFILIGAPLIDRVPSTGRVASALAGVSVAVVGVIAGLAVFVGRHVLVVDGDVDWLAVVLAVGAFVATWRLRVNVVVVVAACGLAGLLASFT